MMMQMNQSEPNTQPQVTQEHANFAPSNSHEVSSEILLFLKKLQDEVESLKKTKKLNKNKDLTFFRKNLKETKEHNMIVDMERNDLSKICKPGSVKILKKKIVEEYKDLYHYVSLIGGQLKNKVTSLEIIKAMMPGGSVIGCPKISTLNLLNKQEKQNRNIYTGSFGYLKFNGDMRFNIIIRSILNFKGKSEISVASGVVIDSNAAHEFNENYIKAKSLMDLYK